MNVTPRSNSSQLTALFLVLISGFGVLAGLLGLLILLLSPLGQGGSNTPVFAWAAAFVVLINLPALIYSAPLAAGRPAPHWHLKDGWRLATIALGFWLLDLVVASLLIGHHNPVSQILFPPLSLLAVALPIWWLIELGRRGLHTTPLRAWGTATVSLMGTIPLVVILELIGFVFLGILILLFLVGSSPDLLSQIQRLTRAMQNGSVGPETLLSTLQPYLQQPGVVLAGLGILAVATPMLEEFFKPLALWFIPGRQLTEAEGFTLGLVAGGIFAMLETLGSLSALATRADLWLALVLTRAGTGLLHITCTGLTGWGLAAAWRNHNYWKLIGLYFSAVAIHGTWNLFAQLISLEGFMPDNSIFTILGRVAPFVLAGIAVAILYLLVRLNRHLKAHQPTETSTEPTSLPAQIYPPIPPAEQDHLL